MQHRRPAARFNAVGRPLCAIGHTRSPRDLTALIRYDSIDRRRVGFTAELQIGQ